MYTFLTHTIDEINRGPSSWKFNNSIINDTTFLNEMSDFIENLNHMTSLNLHILGLNGNFKNIK